MNKTVILVIVLLVAIALAGALGWFLHTPETRIVTEIQYLPGKTDTIPGEIKWKTKFISTVVKDTAWADSIAQVMVRDQFYAAWVLGKAAEGVEQEGTWRDTATVEIQDTLMVVPMQGSFRWGFGVDTTLTKNFKTPMVRVDSVKVPVLIRTVFQTEMDWGITLIAIVLAFAAGALAL